MSFQKRIYTGVKGKQRERKAVWRVYRRDKTQSAVGISGDDSLDEVKEQSRSIDAWAIERLGETTDKDEEEGEGPGGSGSVEQLTRETDSLTSRGKRECMSADVGASDSAGREARKWDGGGMAPEIGASFLSAAPSYCRLRTIARERHAH